MYTRQVRADLLPRASAVAGAKDKLVAVIERLIGRREHLRQRPGFALRIARIGRRQRAAERGHDVQVLVAALCASAEEEVAVLRIRHDGHALAREARRVPVTKVQQTIMRPGRRRYAARVLLRTVKRVRKAIVRGDVVDLRRRLVVPRAPALASVDAHHRTLVAAQHHAVAVVRVHPHLVVVVAARRALDRKERLARVVAFEGAGIDHVQLVRVLRVYRYRLEVPAAPPQPLLVIDAGPGCSGIVRAIDAAQRLGRRLGLGRTLRRTQRPRNRRTGIIDDRPQALGIARGDGNADLADEVVLGQSAA